MVRGSGGRRHDFMTRAGRASPNAGPAARRRGRSWIPSCQARSVEGTLGAARVVSRPISRFEGHLGRAEKPILLPGPDNLTRSPGWIRRQPGNPVNGLSFTDRHREPKSHRASRAHCWRGRPPARGPRCGRVRQWGCQPDRTRRAIERLTDGSLRSTASFSNPA